MTLKLRLWLYSCFAFLSAGIRAVPVRIWSYWGEKARHHCGWVVNRKNTPPAPFTLTRGQLARISRTKPPSDSEPRSTGSFGGSLNMLIFVLCLLIRRKFSRVSMTFHCRDINFWHFEVSYISNWLLTHKNHSHPPRDRHHITMILW